MGLFRKKPTKHQLRLLNLFDEGKVLQIDCDVDNKEFLLNKHVEENNFAEEMVGSKDGKS